MTNSPNTTTTGGNYTANANAKPQNTETVLVLQGGGSLGAYECGVYKALYENGIKFNVLAGSSIGAINSSIITAAQNADKNASMVLESFWLDLAENVTPISFMYDVSNHYPLSPSFDKMISIWSSMWSSFYGNSKAFFPKWLNPNSPYYFDPYEWNYLYDKNPLKKTLKDYIDFDNLKKITTNDEYNEVNNKNTTKSERSRLIITSTDVQKGEAVIFDNASMDIDVDMIVACAGYPFYGIKWSIKDGRYLWDGSLLTNTPIMDVMRASPLKEKEFYIVDVFPRYQEKIPENMIEVWHRARDIMFTDKTDENIEMLKVAEKYSNLLRKMYKIIHSDEAKVDEKTKGKLKELEDEYHSITRKHGASIIDVIRIGRKEDEMHYLFEDADFSRYRIEKLIKEGEKDAIKAIESKKKEKKRSEKK